MESNQYICTNVRIFFDYRYYVSACGGKTNIKQKCQNHGKSSFLEWHKNYIQSFDINNSNYLHEIGWLGFSFTESIDIKYLNKFSDYAHRYVIENQICMPLDKLTCENMTVSYILMNNDRRPQILSKNKWSPFSLKKLSASAVINNNLYVERDLMWYLIRVIDDVSFVFSTLPSRVFTIKFKHALLINNISYYYKDHPFYNNVYFEFTNSRTEKIGLIPFCRCILGYQKFDHIHTGEKISEFNALKNKCFTCIMFHSEISPCFRMFKNYNGCSCASNIIPK